MPNAAEIGCKQQIIKLCTSLFPTLPSARWATAHQFQLRCNRHRRYASMHRKPARLRGWRNVKLLSSGECRIIA